MSKAEIAPGVCGFFTVVEVSSEGRLCNVAISSDCKAIQKIAEELGPLDPMKEISSRRGTPRCWSSASSTAFTPPVRCLQGSSRPLRWKRSWPCRWKSASDSVEALEEQGQEGVGPLGFPGHNELDVHAIVLDLHGPEPGVAVLFDGPPGLDGNAAPHADGQEHGGEIRRELGQIVVQSVFLAYGPVPLDSDASDGRGDAQQRLPPAVRRASVSCGWRRGGPRTWPPSCGPSRSAGSGCRGGSHD